MRGVRLSRKEITTDGRRLTYFDEGSGRPMVLLHAFPLDASMWEPQLAAVPPGWRLLAPDVRGFGGTAPDPGPPASSLDDYAADVLRLLDALGIDRAVVGGLSMGGYITFALLRRAPARLAGLVLADTRPGADTAEGREGRRKLQAAVAHEGAGAAARSMLPKLFASETLRARAGLVDEVRRSIESADPAAIIVALDCMLHRPDSTGLLRSIRLPTLIIVGAEDGLTPPAESEAMREEIAGSTLVVVAGAGHLSNLEQPDRFNAALGRFCAEAFRAEGSVRS